MASEAVMARFDGRCDYCDREIRADEDKIAEVEGEWVHEECADEIEGLS